MSRATRNIGDEETHEFHNDWDHSMRYSLRILYGYLAVLAFALWRVSEDPSATLDVSIFVALAFFLALIGLPAIAFIYRANSGLALFEVSPEGIASPLHKLPRVPWTEVTRVVYQSRRGGRIKMDHLLICFRPGTLENRQFGSLKKDRWEITLSVSTAMFGWQASKLQGSKEELFASIERFAPVER